MDYQTPEVTALSSQVGGSYLLLSENNGEMILKPYNACECAFYEAISSCQDDTWRSLLHHLPKYGGIVELKKDIDLGDVKNDWLSHLPQQKYQKKKQNHRLVQHRYIRLQNLTFGMVKPCILDVKLGIRSWKASHVKFQNSSTPTHNFRLNGFEVYQEQTEQKIFRSKYFFHDIPYERLLSHLAFFFYDGKVINQPAVQELLAKLEQVIQDFETVRGIQAESLSLFVCYEGSKEAPPRTELKLIDFGNVSYEPGASDGNRLRGLKMFHELLSAVSSQMDQLTKMLGTPAS